MFGLLLPTIPLFALLLWGVFVKQHGQNQHDRQRKIYTLTFPANLADDVVTRWVHSISGTLKPKLFGMGGAPSIVFELWATDRGISYLLHVPWQHADYVVGQLRVTIPGIVVTPVDQPLEYKWSSVVEVGEKNPDRALRIMDAGTLAGSLLGSVQALRPGEAVLMQWVVAPTKPRDGVHEPEQNIRVGGGTMTRLLEQAIGASKTPRHIVAEQRTKLAETNVSAVLRVGTRAKTPKRSNHLLQNVRGAMASVNGPGNWFVTTNIPNSMVHDRIARATAPTMWPARLSASELSGLIAWPIGNPNVAGLPGGRARHLAATAAIPRGGDDQHRVVMTSNFPGAERNLALSYRNSCRHAYIVGPTGSGKTVAAAEQAVQDMNHGRGVVIIDPNGNDPGGSLFNHVLDRVPKHRVQDVIIMDVNDTSWPVGFNILNQVNPALSVDNIMRLFGHMYPDLRRGVWGWKGFHYGLNTLVTDPNLTIADLPAVVSPARRRGEDAAWRKELLAKLTDPDLVEHWQDFDKQPEAKQTIQTDPVIDRIWQLIGRPAIRRIIGQSKSAFDMRDILAQKKILLVNLGGQGDEEGRILGALLFMSFWAAAQQSIATEEDPVSVYLDEFQDIMRFPASEMESMLAKGRKYGLSLTMMHQFTAQLPPDTRNAVLTNTLTQMVFQTQGDDARIFPRQFGSRVTEDDFRSLGRFEVIARLATDAGVSGPVTGDTLPPSPPTGLAQQIRQMSRSQYGTARDQVDDEIRQRRTPSNKVTKRQPARGGTPWK